MQLAKPLFWLFTTLLLVGLSRHLAVTHPALFNFTPVLAVFLFCGAHFKGTWSWGIPLLCVLGSDIFLNPGYGISYFEPFMIVTFLSYLLIWALGNKIGAKAGNTIWIFAALGSGIIFHLITCTFAWVVNPAYTKTLSGLFQSMIMGEPGFTPSYLFLRNTLLSTVFFALCLKWLNLWSENIGTKLEFFSDSSAVKN